MKNLYIIPFIFSLLSFVPVSAQLTITFESGLAFPQYNDVRAPNGEDPKGTLFSLVNDFQEVETPIFFRAEARYLLSTKHTFEITAAPLVVESDNYRGSSLRFEDETFSGENITGRYQFNTYRLSYRYRVLTRPKFIADVGISALVRDAAIRIKQAVQQANNTDLGFVPLISFYSKYEFSAKWQALLKGDALVGPQGRAEDVFIGVRFTPDPSLGIKLGYRVIEGGANVDQVYNFAFFHFASAGVVYTW